MRQPDPRLSPEKPVEKFENHSGFEQAFSFLIRLLPARLTRREIYIETFEGLEDRIIGRYQIEEIKGGIPGTSQSIQAILGIPAHSGEFNIAALP